MHVRLLCTHSHNVSPQNVNNNSLQAIVSEKEKKTKNENKADDFQESNNLKTEQFE